MVPQHTCRMTAVPSEQPTPTSVPPPKNKQMVIRIATVVLFGLLLGFCQNWMAPRYYGPELVAGFHLGVIHGTVMPAALPTLLMGKDVAIYAPTNEGRPYKIGYILGINLCGTLFFGFSFLRFPKTKKQRKQSMTEQPTITQ